MAKGKAEVAHLVDRLAVRPRDEAAEAAQRAIVIRFMDPEMHFLRGTALAAAIRAGTCESLLHSFAPVAGDCVFIPAGTVHAIGAGLLVAEIQQSSDVTYRLFDWNRTGPDGRPRPLHVEAGVEAVTRLGPVDPVRPEASADSAVRRLVGCEFFTLDEVRPAADWHCGGDDRCHVLAVLEGEARLPARWGLPAVAAGDCVLLPATVGAQEIAAAGAKLLHVAVP